MIFDAETLARGWLSVAVASVDAGERPALDRTVCIEEFANGARLVATDSYVLLHSWVPRSGEEGADEPGADEAPRQVAVAIDPYGRGKGMLAHLLKLATAKDAIAFDCTLELGVVEPEDPDVPTLSPDLDATWVVLEHPDAERQKLRTFEGRFPAWRKVEAGFRAKKTDGIALNPEIIGRLAKLGKFQPGAPLVWHFGGENKAAMLEIGECRGLVMPMRWDFDRDAPMPTEDDA